jgi:predicted methyltransferase
MAAIDLAFICDVYHHFEHPQASLVSLHKAMKPGGELALIDFQKIQGVTGEFIMNHVRAGQEVFEAEVIAAGFEKTAEGRACSRRTASSASGAGGRAVDEQRM